MKILDPGKAFGEFGQLVIMGGKERFGLRMRVDIFDHSPCDGQSVIGGGAAPDLIQQHQRARSGGVENGCSLRHLHHEGGASAGQVVTGANAGEDAVHDADARRACGHKRSHLCHQDNQRRLPQVGAFTAHVGTGDEQDGVRAGIQKQIIGHKADGTAELLRFDHGMAAFHDLNLAALVKLWAAVTAIGGNLCQ